MLPRRARRAPICAHAAPSLLAASARLLLVCAHTHHSHTCRTRPCTPTTQVELNWYNNTYANPEDGTDFYGIDIIGDELHLKSGEFKLTLQP